MAEPQDFLKVASSSFLTYSIISFMIGVSAYLSLGPQMASPLTETSVGAYEVLGSKVFIIDTNVLVSAKILCLCTLIACYYLQSTHMLNALDKM